MSGKGQTQHLVFGLFALHNFSKKDEIIFMLTIEFIAQRLYNKQKVEQSGVKWFKVV